MTPTDSLWTDDASPLTDAERMLFESCVPMARKLARARQSASTLTDVDFQQESLVLLTEAVRKYDPDWRSPTGQASKFSTFAYAYVKENLWRLANRTATERIKHATDEPGEDIPVPPAECDDSSEQLQAAFATLTRRERAIVNRRFGLGRPPQTVAEVAESLRISRTAVQDAEASALAKMRERLGEWE